MLRNYQIHPNPTQTVVKGLLNYFSVICKSVKMVITVQNVITNVKLIKAINTEVEWKIENYDANRKFTEDLELPCGVAIHLEIRGSQYNFVKRSLFIQPFYKISFGESEVEALKISFKEAKSNAFCEIGFVSPSDEVKCAGEEFLNHKDLKSCLEDGNLTIIVQVVGLSKCSSSELETSLENLLKGNKLIEDLNEFVGQNQISDFTCHVDDFDFPIHKMMLAARSPVFYKIFTEDFKHKKRGNINDISKEAFEAFLHFIYTGRINRFDEHAEELWKMANKYEVSDLRTACELYFLQNSKAKVEASSNETNHQFGEYLPIDEPDTKEDSNHVDDTFPLKTNQNEYFKNGNDKTKLLKKTKKVKIRTQKIEMKKLKTVNKQEFGFFEEMFLSILTCFF
ncbi:CLUMA_CG012092, isoform A [Clunio marinus]|uniref:CLUMA_CG012092, isoform A n=1 Tax=Clunio marinus TaxID=568069 RepID=A0A1J1IFW3_9DIPT|nr:CLUMA_CG012092, isoform A [Clunio marinus]